MNKKIKIVLVDDEILIRKGVKAILEQEDKFQVIEEFENGQFFVDYIENVTEFPDIVLIDIKMPSLNGIEATKILTSKFPNLKIIALSNYTSDIFIANMIEVGAVAYLSKSAPPKEMLETILAVYENGFFYNSYVLKFVSDTHQDKKSILDANFLSDREKEVLTLICLQKSATEIGEILHISPRTVDGHRNNLLQKTDSKSLVGLVVFAIQNDLFVPDFYS